MCDNSQVSAGLWHVFYGAAPSGVNLFIKVIILLSPVFRAAVTMDDAGIVMDSVGDSGVTVSTEHHEPCTEKW